MQPKRWILIVNIVVISNLYLCYVTSPISFQHISQLFPYYDTLTHAHTPTSDTKLSLTRRLGHNLRGMEVIECNQMYQCRKIHLQSKLSVLHNFYTLSSEIKKAENNLWYIRS